MLCIFINSTWIRLIDVLSKIYEILHKRLKYAWWVYDKWNMTRDRRYIYPNRFLESLRLWPFATNCLLKMVTQLKLFFAISAHLQKSPKCPFLLSRFCAFDTVIKRRCPFWGVKKNYPISPWQSFTNNFKATQKQ